MIKDELECGHIFNIDNVTNGYIDTMELKKAFDTECIWYIMAPPGYSIALHFTDFDLEADVYCLHDSLIIMDGDNFNIPFGPYCGQSLPNDILSNFNIIKLIFERHPANSTKGFSVDFSAVGKLYIISKEVNF